MVNKKICLLRDYQVTAVRALQQAAQPGKHCFLLEMATGTGKTLLNAAITKLYLRTENAHHILFLVERLEPEKQAEKNYLLIISDEACRTISGNNRAIRTRGAGLYRAIGRGEGTWSAT